MNNMEFDNVIVKENPGLCRCCLSEGCYKELGTEYPWMDETEVYADMLLECFDISISQHVEGPNGTHRLICEVCITRLRDACNFKKQVLDCEKRFVDMVGRGEFKQKVIAIDNTNMKSELGLDDTVDNGGDIEYLDEGMDFNNDKEDTQDITVETLPMKAKRGRPRKNAAKPERKVKEEKSKGTKTIRGAKLIDKSSEALIKSSMSATKRNRLMKRNAIVILEHSTVVPFKWHRHSYMCFFCHRHFEDFEQLAAHTIDDHEKSNIKSAVLYLKRDEKVKIDVTSLACRVCKVNLDDLKALIDHTKSEHDAEFNEQYGLGVVPYKLLGQYQCAVCCEKFDYFIKLNQHMNGHYGSYVCESCGKSFLSRDRLRSHCLSHGFKFNCGICDEQFDSLTRKYKHESDVHDRGRTIKCLYCPSTFRNYNLRKEHHRYSHDVDVPRISCPVCRKQFGILSKMRVHLKEVHLRERNFSCSMCDQKFFSRTHLQRHAVRHTGLRIYECDVCKKSYARKQTLKDHMRVHCGDVRGVPSSMRIRRNLETLFNNTTVIPFKFRGKYLCFFCSKYVDEYAQLREHTKSHGRCTMSTHSLKAIRGVTNVEIKIDVSVIKCEVCMTDFPNMTDVVRHLTEVHDIDYDSEIGMPLEEYRLRDLICLQCDTKFTYFGYLVSHVNSEHPKNTFTCDACEQKFNKKRDLFSHKKNYHREGGFVCDACHQTFTSLNILNKHKINRHITRCNICYLKLPSAVLKRKHMKTEHPDDGCSTCKICDKQFHTNIGLKMHSRNCRSLECVTANDRDGDVMDSDVRYDVPKRHNVKQLRENIATVISLSTAIPFSFFHNKFNCFYCSKDFQDPDKLKEHTVLTHPVCDVREKSILKCRESESSVKIDISSLACKVCFESMNDLDALLDHLIVQHEANYDKSIKTCLQPYRLVKDHMKCPLCPNEVFRFFGTLLKHMNTKHTDNKNICVHCGQSFRREQNLRVHLWRRHSYGKFNCSTCGLDCELPSRLFMHMAKEHGVKAAKCPICSEAFETQYLRQKHLIVAHNTGHKCTYCGKLFTRDSFMKDHVSRTHLKEKNVECGVCNAKFFNNILLRRHMVKHSGVKNFHCDLCGDRFYWKKSLSSHMVKHKRNDEFPH